MTIESNQLAFDYGRFARTKKVPPIPNTVLTKRDEQVYDLTTQKKEKKEKKKSILSFAKNRLKRTHHRHIDISII